MYRHVILDFLSSNRKTIQENQITQMTFVLFQEEHSDLSRFCIATDEVLLYHVKEPYVFEKKYSMDQMTGTVVEIALEFDSPLVFQKEELSYTILEPYGQKDLLTIDFQSLVVVKMEKQISKVEKRLLGLVIFYSQISHPDIAISTQKLLTLKSRLEKDAFSDVFKQVQEKVFLSQPYYIVIYHRQREFYYCNDAFVQALGLHNPFVLSSDASVPKLQRKLAMMHQEKLEDWDTYYLSFRFSLSERKEQVFYATASVEQHPFVSSFTLVYIKDLKKENDYIALEAKWRDFLEKNMPDVLYQCYFIDANTIVMICNHVYKKREILDFTYHLKHIYSLFVTCPKEIQPHMQLQPLIEYINEMLPDQFSYTVYSQYLDQKNREKLLWDALYPRTKLSIIQAKDEHVIGNLVMSPLPNGYSQSVYRIFEDTAIQLMEESVHKALEMPVYTMLVTAFSRRKVIEVLKKVIKTYPDAKLILHMPPIYQIEAKKVYEVINQCIAMGFIVIVDSTIYMNLQFNIVVPLVDALFIRKNECKNSILNHNSLNQVIFKEMYQQNKVIIFEEIPSEEDVEMINELTCLIVER